MMYAVNWPNQYLILMEFLFYFCLERQWFLQQARQFTDLELPVLRWLGKISI